MTVGGTMTKGVPVIKNAEFMQGKLLKIKVMFTFVHPVFRDVPICFTSLT